MLVICSLKVMTIFANELTTDYVNCLCEIITEPISDIILINSMNAIVDVHVITSQ